MKNLFVSSAARALLVVWLWSWAAPAWAGVAARGNACLDVVDVACADVLAAQATDAPEDLRFRARLAFHHGAFDEAVRLQEQVQKDYAGEGAFASELALYQATRSATEGFVAERRGDVEIRYLPGTDLVLLDDAFATLQATHDRIGKRLGGAPPGGVRVEIYPTAARFIAASGLGADNVRRTGVVALSKWSRLLVTSPRALLRGYAWKDTIAHEYIHYLVAWRTRDRTPVWLQEGIARSHESLWRGDTLSSLPSYQQSLLADALRKDTLVTLEQMHPSMAFLPTAEMASLAFAQVSTMVDHLEATAGAGATARVLEEVRDGTDALQAVADVATGGDRDRFQEGWKESLKRISLIQRKLAAPVTVLDGAGDDLALDPILGRRADLAGLAHIGDLLLAQNRADAALVEYRKATPEDEPASPMLSVRLARALVQLGKVDEAMAALRSSIADYAEYATTRKDLGALLLKAGRTADALVEYKASADINPFDPEVHASLADLYAATGDSVSAARHRTYRQILTLGGADPQGAAIGR